MSDKETPKKPQTAQKNIDWDALKQAFIMQSEYTSPRTWLREMQEWPENRLDAGNTKRQIDGWGTERAQIRQQVAEETYQNLRMIEKERLSELLKGKLNLMKHIMDEIDNEGALSKYDPKDLKILWEIVKTELGEPTSISKTGILGDRDSLEAAERELRAILADDTSKPANTSNTEEISKAL